MIGLDITEDPCHNTIGSRNGHHCNGQANCEPILGSNGDSEITNMGEKRHAELYEPIRTSQGDGLTSSTSIASRFS